jgi:hypothetical protein
MLAVIARILNTLNMGAVVPVYSFKGCIKFAARRLNIIECFKADSLFFTGPG